MRRNTNHQKASAEKVVKDIRRATRRQFGAEDEDPDRSGGPARRRTVSLSCVAVRGSTRTSITAGRRTSWRPGRSSWRVTLPREATSDEVRHLRSEALALKEAVADLTLDNRLLKKA